MQSKFFHKRIGCIVVRVPENDCMETLVEVEMKIKAFNPLQTCKYFKRSPKEILNLPLYCLQ